MFTKTLIVAALAFSAEALKLENGLQTGSLAGVDINALSKTELKALLEATAA